MTFNPAEQSTEDWEQPAQDRPRHDLQRLTSTWLRASGAAMRYWVAMIAEACARMNCRQVGPPRRGAGGIRCSRRRVRMAVAETLMPS